MASGSNKNKTKPAKAAKKVCVRQALPKSNTHLQSWISFRLLRKNHRKK